MTRALTKDELEKDHPLVLRLRPIKLKSGVTIWPTSFIENDGTVHLSPADFDLWSKWKEKNSNVK